MVKISLSSSLGQKTEKAEGEADKTEILIPQADDVQTLPATTQKPTLSRILCVSVVLIILLSTVVLGIICTFRYYHLTQNRFHCRVMYNEDFASVPSRAQLQLEEDVEIRLEEEVELVKVPVPEFEGGDAANIIHDFYQSLTAYHDLSLDRCYIIELNRTIILPPRNLWELLAKMKLGTYLPQTYIIQEEMEVTEQISNVHQLGSFIRHLCSGKKTYKLKRKSIQRTIDKRAIKNCHRIRHLVNTFVIETSICDKD
ncbi:integral membrane protein 2C-like [Hypanus sabinus]|uniref:integral membrane protein 2C-like n=1 Tax=Hypanus sabinus TaxID=79690 RepID=UPI0028C4DB96|nr:integral membrane protein 2C-like [Hypanus sabinus]XP_059804069.1 integral membrane protein 2C-like [Hypanus sabinus]